MSYALSETHQKLRERVREFAEKHIRPIAQELDDKEEFSVELTRKLGEQGVLGMLIPTEYGGQGFDSLSLILAIEELSRVDGSQGVLVSQHNTLGVLLISRYGTEQQKRRYLPRLCTGEALWAFGLTEPEAGSDTRSIQTRAKKVEGGWLINGAKMFITNGNTPITAGVTVLAVTDETAGRLESTSFLVETGTPGFAAETMQNKMMWRASNVARLYFKDCFVPDEQVLGEVGRGHKSMLDVLNTGRLGIAAMGLGCAQGAYELALEYAKSREQFGQPLSGFQAIAFKLADIATGIEHARLFLYHACRLADSGAPFAKEASMAKLYCSERAKESVDHAVQIHGGRGLLKEYPVEKFYRDQRVLEIAEGTSEIQRMVIAKQIGCFQ